MRARRRRQWCTWLTWFIVAAMGAVCLVFFADPYRPGLLDGPVEFWALSRKWQFYLLLIAVAGSAAASAALWWIGRGVHRLLLVGMWAVFVTALIVYHADRVRVMIQLMWRYG